MSYSSALTLIVIGLIFIVYEDMLCHAVQLRSLQDVLECVSDTVIVMVMCVKFLPISLSFGWQVILLAVELLLVKVLATTNLFDWALNIAGFLGSIGSSYCLISASLVKRQITLVSVQMTYKEFLCRQEHFSQDPKLTLSSFQRLKNIVRFFFYH